MSRLSDFINKRLRRRESDDDIVVVASYDSSAMAYVDKDILENEGIDAAVDDDLLMRYVPLASPGVALRVRRRDLLRARLILHLDDPPR